ncbi:MAG: hypothetical protein GX880_10765 [Methanomicrobiales archaeon]|nr:hypothetical protein [Methanomicrobiales archaeon]
MYTTIIDFSSTMQTCRKGKTVYRSQEVQAGICEGCHARLVREWNAKAGVR